MALNRKGIIKTLGYLTLLLGCSMLPALAMAWRLAEHVAFSGFLASFFTTCSAAFVLIWHTRTCDARLRVRDGMIVVAFGWLIASLLGALPYLITGSLRSFPDAWFESVSGFTTSGATVFSDIEALPSSILLWRSFSQWLGGMGILVFVMSILPAVGSSGHSLLFAETSGLNVQKLDTQHHGSAKRLYAIYIALTLVQIALLSAGGLSVTDSAALSLGSIASSGLTIHNDGLLRFDSPYVEAVLACFMILSCINFTLYYHAICGEFQRIKNNIELRVFLGILAVFSLIVTLSLWHKNVCDLPSAFRYGVFQTVSFLTTTGHVSTDLAAWPVFTKATLTLLTFIGGQAASTSGALKVVRIIILFKLIRRSFTMRIHPHAVLGIKLEGQPMDSTAVNGVVAYFYTYLSLLVISAFLISFDTNDMACAFLSAQAMLGNTGTVLDASGAWSNYMHFAQPTKLLFSVLMLAGRLEIYTVMLLGSKAFWTHDR